MSVVWEFGTYGFRIRLSNHDASHLKLPPAHDMPLVTPKCRYVGSCQTPLGHPITSSPPCVRVVGSADASLFKAFATLQGALTLVKWLAIRPGGYRPSPS